MLGPVYGIFTGLFDIFKGFFTITLAYNLIPNFYLIFGVFISAVVGHDYPFYLNFKGGIGLATTLGSLLAISIILKNDLPLLIIATTALFTIYLILTRFIVLPSRFNEKYREKKNLKVKIWRKLLRFAALLFPITYLVSTKELTLVLVSISLLISTFVEFIRLKFLKVKNNIILNSIFKPEEKNKISTILYFLISTLLTVIFFSKSIAIVALFFLIVGDNLATIIGTKYGLIKLIGNKTLEGSFSCFASCFFIGIFLLKFLPLSFTTILLGSLAATFIELMPLKIGRIKIDDNFSIPIFSALIMKLLS